MKLLRNREVRRGLAVRAGLGVAMALAGLTLGRECALALLAAGAVYTLVYWLGACRRRRLLTKLGASIDRVLHGQEAALLCDSEEGELSILQSEIQKMTLRLKETTDRLQEDKLHLTDAVADISHQLRTPLTAMNLTVSLLCGRPESEARRLELLHSLKRSLERIDWLIEALLWLSKLDAGTAQFRMEQVSLRVLAQRAAAPFLIPMELRGQRFELAVGDEHFRGDMAWSVEALGNLLKNCMEHTPAGGCIRVSACDTALYTELRVEDDGEGIDPADLPHLFERFYRGRNAGDQSVGIGLALARRILTEENGTIKAANRKEGGASFIIRFYHSVI